MTHDPDTVERDNAAIAYDAVVSTPRNEPSAFKRQCFRDGWDAALSAMPAQGVKVKPLEWVTPSPTTDGQWQDTTGIYDIEECILFIGHVETGIRFETVKEAKAAAQADYEARILSALDLPTPPVSKGD